MIMVAEQLVLKDLRIKVNNEYVGFSPDGDSIKPIHVAGGVFRVIYGATLNTKMIKQFAFVVSKTGIYPNDPKSVSTKKGGVERTAASAIIDEQVVSELIDKLNCFDETPSKDDLRTMRMMLQKLLGTDDGLYPDNSQLTFSAGSKYFIKGHAQYEDAGEFIGGVVKEYCPELANYIRDVLNAAEDPISVLMSPMEDATELTEINDADLRHKRIPAFVNQGTAMKWYLKGLKDSGDCLKKNLEKMPNALTRLRIFNFFCIYHLVRYMSLLEAFYCEGRLWPFLLDFSNSVQSGIAVASTTSYAKVHQSVSRFYSWAFAKKLIDEGKTKLEMIASVTPVYDDKKANKDQTELVSQWELAKENAKSLPEEQAMLEFGKTIYNMSSMESSSYPVTFLRILGAQAGIVFPTQRDSKRKRFKLSQDTLEMVIRSCVSSNETITYDQLCTRMWERFNIVISGMPVNEDEQVEALKNDSGLDSDVLEDNHQKCVRVLEGMDFADLMADGILRVHLGGTN